MQSLQTSVEQFADDVRRYQQGLPVTARRGTRGYLAKKFLARNKALSFAVVCSCSRFLPVRGMALWQAHRAEMEREGAERKLIDF